VREREEAEEDEEKVVVPYAKEDAMEFDKFQQVSNNNKY
jgi:hypothetical protein